MWESPNEYARIGIEVGQSWLPIWWDLSIITTREIWFHSYEGVSTWGQLRSATFYTYLCLFTYLGKCSALRAPKADLLVLKFQVSVSYLTWILEIKFKNSRGVAGFLSHIVIYLFNPLHSMFQWVEPTEFFLPQKPSTISSSSIQGETLGTPPLTALGFWFFLILWKTCTFRFRMCSCEFLCATTPSCLADTFPLQMSILSRKIFLRHSVQWSMSLERRGRHLNGSLRAEHELPTVSPEKTS